MALRAGTKLGVYEIGASIGAGGMGEVYRARDTRLNRSVAVKILPEIFARDDDRRARFEREATTLAALNHPHIAQIYGFEQSGDLSALVMELVEGEDLAQRIARGPVPLDEAVAIARQIADALEASHDAGIIHRDLKPANIRLTEAGVVKVLDFGLAKAMETGAASRAGMLDSPTITSPAAMTHAGVIIGTAAYMSPEQARGKAVDRRSDVWGFGCVLYEMLAGRRPFDGESVTDVLAAVLKTEPDWTALPAETPPAIRRLLRRCLERDPKRRLRDMADARLELDPLDEPAVLRRDERRVLNRVVPLIALFVAGAMLATLLVWSWLRPGPPAESVVRRFGLSLPLILDAHQSVALSPDGQRLAFRGRASDGVDRLFVRELDSVSPRWLPGTEGARLPFFSADGQQVGFFAGGQLKRVSLTGGEPQIVAPAPNSTGGAWADDNTIVFISDSRQGILRVPAAGGAPEVLLEAKDGQVATPWVLPGGRGVLFAARHDNRFDISVLSLADGSARVLAEGAWTPVWSNTGHVLYQQNDTIFAVPFDPRRLEATGDAVPVLAGVGTRISLQSRMFSLSADGTLVYMPAATGPDSRWTMTWVDRNGRESVIAGFTEPADTPRLSPDGSRIAFRRPGPNCDVWSYELERGTSTRLTLEGDNHGVVWSADGERVMSVSVADRPELITVPSDGSGVVERLSVKTSTPLAWPTFWAEPVGTALVTQGSDVIIVSLASGETRPLLNSPFAESHAVLSPDSRWVAYVSDQSGRSEVYVQPYPAPGRRLQVSTDGGSEPVWSPLGRELFFRSGNTLLAVMFDGSSVSRPATLFSSDHLTGPGTANYDVSGDGKRFLMVRGPGHRDEGNLVVVLNWLDTWRK